jgi:hypothetical protein
MEVTERKRRVERVFMDIAALVWVMPSAILPPRE